jgi:hypothetical protein
MGGVPGEGKTITGAPYTGVEVRETTETLANGNSIDRKVQTTIYRDSAGRVRTETTLPARGRAGQTATAAAATPHTVITIHDPVARVTREVNATTKTVRETPMPRGRGRGTGASATSAATTPRAGRGNRATPATTNPNVVHETLAMQTINGVQATGERVTRTIPAGQMGNAQPIQTVHETWMSVDLKVPVMVKDTNPHGGATTVQLTNITRSEPDPALFQSPSDYKVIQVGHGRGVAK